MSSMIGEFGMWRLAGAMGLAVMSGATTSGAAVTLSGDTNPSDPAAINMSAGLDIGINGVGSLSVDGASDILSGITYLGRYVDGNGTASITGAGSSWGAGELFVGGSGSGAVNVYDGATFTSTFGILGFDPNSSGSVAVNGAGSTWTATDKLKVGAHGSGMLSINNGGIVNSDFGQIGYYRSAAGTATVSGVGSAWNIAQDLLVGHEGIGTLRIASGGVVASSSGYIGGNGGYGNVTVSGATWTNTGLLSVGREGGGSLEVSSDGVMTSGDAYVGRRGSVGVIGFGSTWNSTGELQIDGRVEIFEGGQVSSDTGWIDQRAEVYISYHGSWTVTGDLLVGRDNWDALRAGDALLTLAEGTMNTGSGSIRNGARVQIGSGSPSSSAQWNIDSSLMMSSDSVVALLAGGRIEVGGNMVIADHLSTLNLSGGTLDLNGHSIYSGGTFNFSSGRLKDVAVFQGSLHQQGGVLETGNTGGGVTRISGDYAMTAGASIEVELFGAGGVAGADFDQLVVNRDTAFDGTLTVLLAEDFNPEADAVFQIFQLDGQSEGAFDLINLPALASGLAWDTSLLYSAGEISVSLVPIPGDYNGDRVVDQSDLTLVLTGWGATSAPEGWTASFDGEVDQNELTALLHEWGAGMGAASSSSSSAVVPEPASVMLFGLGALAMLRRARTR